MYATNKSPELSPVVCHSFVDMARHRGARYHKVPRHSQTSAVGAEIKQEPMLGGWRTIIIAVVAVVGLVFLVVYLAGKVPGLSSPFTGRYSS